MRIPLRFAASVIATLSLAAPAAATSVSSYVAPVGSAYDLTPLLSVGDRVPETNDPALEYQMVGIPDGLGVVKNPDGTSSVYMNHEFNKSVASTPIIGGSPTIGAFVSKFELGSDGTVLSGARAYDTVWAENAYVGPAAQADNSTPGFSRFCSGFLAGPEVGFDRTIFLTGEESKGAATFDGRGGQAVAIFDGEAHTLPMLGRFAYENVVVMPGTGDKTVIFGMEDGPSTPDSQLWMYVGTKDRSPGAGVLARNGLDNGTLYVFASRTIGRFDEFTVRDGVVAGVWIPIPGVHTMTDTELEIAADSAGAFAFIRPEDAAFAASGDLFFVTTGGNAAAGNELGRLYQLRLNPLDATLPAVLRVVYNADQIVAAGGDIALSPDNIGIGAGYLMIQEDGTTQSRRVMATKGRDGSIWRIPLIDVAGLITLPDPGSAERVVTLAPPGRDGTPVGPGVWETSGIIDASANFGNGSFLFDVQAHSPTVAPAPGTVEDGQLVLMAPAV